MEGETELQMVQRHVREGEMRLSRQRDLIARLQERGIPTDEAIILLQQFTDLQRLHKAQLGRLKIRHHVATATTVLFRGQSGSVNILDLDVRGGEL